MTTDNLKYIVFCIDSKINQHDGKVFSGLRETKLFIEDCIKEKWADKFIIGSFVLNNSESMNIEFIETFGIAGSKKDIMQLDLFNIKH